MKMKKVVSLGGCLILAASLLASDVTFAAEKSAALAEKHDEILIETDAAGNVTSRKASVTITGTDASGAIKDKTLLTDITNISGEESFTQGSDGTITWENTGNDINYTGTFNEELPFAIKVTYYLNDQEIKPEDLAGKSGHIKIVYSFENRATIDVDVDGEILNTHVPFLAVTTITLPIDDFQNVESLDGGLIVEEFGSQYFLLGVATPGANESLNLEAIGLDQYVKFPESFGFSADVENFQMPSTITSITPHSNDKLDFSRIKATDSVDEQINELVSAAQKLVDGSGELAGGTSQLSAGISQFVNEFQNGLTQIANGSAQLDNELYDLEAKKSTLQGQAGELLAYLDSILNQLYGFELPEPDSIFSAELMESQKKLEDDAALLISALETMKAQLEEIQAFAPEAEAYVEQMTAIGNTVYQELSAIDLDQMIADATALAKEQAIAAAKEEFSGLPIPEEQLNEIVNNIMSKVDISSVTEEARVHISKVEETLTSIPQIEIPEFQVDVEPIVEILQDMQSQFTVLETAADQQEGVTQLLNSAQEFMDSVKESSSVLRNKSSELIAGLDFADSAIKNAQDYINTLRTAASEASQGSAQLSDGAAQIDNGAKQLADGTEQYYTEGILTAADYARQATLKAFISRCKAYIYAAKQYNNITGIEDATEGSVRFTVRTEEITAP